MQGEKLCLLCCENEDVIGCQSSCHSDIHIPASSSRFSAQVKLAAVWYPSCFLQKGTALGFFCFELCSLWKGAIKPAINVMSYMLHAGPGDVCVNVGQATGLSKDHACTNAKEK